MSMICCKVVLLALGPLPGRASGDGGAEAAGKLPAETSEFDLWTAGEPEEAIPEFHDVKDAACSYFLDPISWPGVRSQLQDIVFRGVPIDHELARIHRAALVQRCHGERPQAYAQSCF